MARTVQLEETLGEGAFGVVHLARVSDDEGFVQRLAVKMLHAHYSADDDLARRLRDEARLLALLEHDNIVRVHGLSRIDGRLAILMEPIQGADLSSAQGTPMPTRVALQVVEAVASALCAAWETVPPGHAEPLKAVHRDIKPSNIMVTERGGVKVMDFGVARARFDHRESQTQSQQFGTARYMAPERWLEGVSGAPSDIFSLGITLVELVTGEPVARPRLSRTSFQEDLSALCATLDDPQICDLVVGMCAFDPNDRPDARAVVQRCRVLEEGIGGPSLRTWAEEWVPEHRIVPSDGSGSSLSGQAATFAWAAEGEATSTVAFEPPTVAPTATVPVPQPSSEDAVDTPPVRRRPAALWVGGGVVALAVVLWGSGVVGPRATGVDTLDALSAEVTPPEPAAPEPAAPEDVVPADVAPASGAPAPDGVDVEAEPLTQPAPAVRVPVGQAEPSPPAAVPAQSRPAPAVVAPVEPETLSEEPPDAEAASSTVTFALRPPSLTAVTGDQTLSHYAGARLRHGVHQVRVVGAEGEWQCTVRVDQAPATWRIDDDRQSCARIQ